MEVSQAPGRVAGFREVGGQVARRRVGGRVLPDLTVPWGAKSTVSHLGEKSD